jgi:serine/threonine protein kinase
MDYITNEALTSRHNDAIVIRDPQTQQLILRGASPSFTNCPTCHRPLRGSSPERNPSPHHVTTPFISPEYFRMLHDAHDQTPIAPSSPIRRLVEPAFPSAPNSPGSSVADAEFMASTPAPQVGHSIKKEAFSPGYFKRFFIEEKELGRGGKGVVLLVRHELDRVSLGQFACKRVPVGDDHAWLEKVLIEVQLLQGLSHPNLVSYRHVWLEDVHLNRFGPSVPCAFILQQYCNSGDLLHYIVGPGPIAMDTKEHLKAQLRRRSKGESDRPDFDSSQRKLSFEEIYSFFKDITSGLAHLHASNYIHRDLKPSNCLLHLDGNDLRCLISDFGEVQPENVVRKSTGSTGTISYCAPEVLKKDQFGRYGNFTTKSDIFSLGMILYFMCFGRLPYKSVDSFQEDYEDIDLLRAEISGWSGFQDERRERPELPNQLYNFLKRLLAIDPTDRPRASEILQAIQTEKGLDNPPRSRNGSSSKLTGRIIQSVDSPMPPGTPNNGICPTPASKFGLTDPEPRRVRSQAYLEDAPLSPSPSPSPDNQLIHENHRRPSSPTILTPLLMPPPSTYLETIYHRLSLCRHYFLSWTRRNGETLQLIAELSIFLVKMLSITKLCLPAATRESVWYPLMALAALELALRTKIGWKTVATLALVHVSVLVGVMQFGPGLCVGRDLESWGWGEEL